jgi:hypothetical protein
MPVPLEKLATCRCNLPLLNRKGLFWNRTVDTLWRTLGRGDTEVKGFPERGVGVRNTSRVFS